MRIAQRAGVTIAVMLGWHALAFGQAYECTVDGKVTHQGMPCGTSTQTKSIPETTSGVVYLRSDTIEYL